MLPVHRPFIQPPLVGLRKAMASMFQAFSGASRYEVLRTVGEICKDMVNQVLHQRELVVTLLVDYTVQAYSVRIFLQRLEPVATIEPAQGARLLPYKVIGQKFVYIGKRSSRAEQFTPTTEGTTLRQESPLERLELSEEERQAFDDGIARALDVLSQRFPMLAFIV